MLVIIVLTILIGGLIIALCDRDGCDNPRCEVCYGPDEDDFDA